MFKNTNALFTHSQRPPDTRGIDYDFKPSAHF